MNINYYLINNLQLIYFLPNGSKRYLSFLDLFEQKSYMRSITNEYCFQLATFGDINGNIVIVNVAEVTSYSLSNNSLTINFQNDSVIVTFLDSTDATNNYDYLTFVWKNYSPANRAFAGKYEISVNSSLPVRDGSNYHAIQDAIDYVNNIANALTTCYIHIYAGTYSGAVTLSSIDLWFDDGAICEDNSADVLFDINQNTIVNIYGRGEFIKNNSNYFLRVLSAESTVNLAFTKIIVDVAGSAMLIDTTYVSNGCKMRLKGESIMVNEYLLSCDGSIPVIDIDINSVMSGLQLLGSQKASTQYRYIRSSDITVKGEDLILYSDSTSGLIQQYDYIINCTCQTEGAHLLQTESLDKIMFWNNIFSIKDTNGFLINVFNDNFNRVDVSHLHGVNISNVVFSDGDAFYHGTLTIDSADNYDLANGLLTYTTDNETDITLSFASIPFAEEYEIYNNLTLLDTVDTLQYEYTLPARVSIENFYRLRYRAKRGATYSSYSNSAAPKYYIYGKIN